jgi:hypothetical protein
LRTATALAVVIGECFRLFLDMTLFLDDESDGFGPDEPAHPLTILEEA